MQGQSDYSYRIAKKTGQAGLEQLGYICKDLNLYNFIDKTELGKSIVGKEMDDTGRWMFNHRFGGGHLWWKELKERPISEWGDVLEHLASDFFTPQGLPYVFDGSMISNNKDLLNVFSETRSLNNWAMINGFEFIAGASALVFTIYDATHLNHGYESDMALAADGLFVCLNIAGGIATANPFLVVAALMKTSTLMKKANLPISINSKSPFDVSVSQMLNLQYNYDANINKIISLTNTFDYLYNNKIISF